MTELYERLLTQPHEASAKCRPVYFVRAKQEKKTQVIQIFSPLRLPFSCLRNLKLFRDIKGSNFT